MRGHGTIRWHSAWRILLILTLLLASGCRERSGRLRVVFSANTQGFLEDCGCSSEPQGGLARRAAILGRLRGEGWPLLLLDGGNLHRAAVDESSRRGAEAIVRIMNRLGYDLAVLGARDFALPTTERAFLLRGATFSWLGGGYRNARAGLGVDTLWVKEAGGLVVGVVDSVDPAWPPNGLAATLLDEGLLRRARRLRPYCDLLVVVTSSDPRASEPLARSLEGLADLLLVTGGPEATPRPLTVGTVMIASVGDRGRNLGCLDLTVEKGRITARDWTLLPVDARAEDPVIAEMVREYVQNEEGLERARCERLRMGRLFKQGLNPATMPGDKALTWYAGEKSCRPCHAAQSEAWRASAHASSYADLPKTGGDPAAERRAVTGWLERGGWLSREDTPGLAGVQCEACHGRGHTHVVSQGELPLETDLGSPSAACATCHDQAPPRVDPHSLAPLP